MLFIKPIALTPAMITASNAGAADPAYDASVSYALGERVYVDASRKSYECVQSPSVGRTPSSSPLYWMLVETSNRWSMFDAKTNENTQTIGNLMATVTPGRRCNAITLHGLVGNSVTITQRNQAGELLYQTTKTLRASPSGWYEYFFAERNQIRDLVFDDLLMVSGGRIEIDVDGTTCSCNAVTVGTRHDIGELQMGATSSMIDYSKKTVTTDGKQDLEPGRFSKRISGRLKQARGQYGAHTRLLEGARATPSVWVGAPGEIDYEPLTVLGVLRDFVIGVEYTTHNICNIEIEGISTL